MEWPRDPASHQPQRRTGGPVDSVGAGSDVLGVKHVDWLHKDALDEWPAPRAFAEASILSVAVPPIRIRQEAAPSAADPRYHLLFHLDGYGRYRADGVDLEQAPGDIVLLQASQPCEVVHPAGARVLRWTLPATRVAPLLGSRSDAAIHRLRGDHGTGAILTHYARDIASADRELSESTQRGLLEQLYALVGLAFQAGGPTEARPAPARTTQQARLLSYVEAHYRDPELTPSRAAADLGLSRRWLHVLAADIATSFSDLVAARRLEESVELLADPELDRVPISDIAFRTGFNDLSTFYRRFARHYGSAPGEVRRRHRAPEGGSGSRRLTHRQPGPADH